MIFTGAAVPSRVMVLLVVLVGAGSWLQVAGQAQWLMVYNGRNAGGPYALGFARSASPAGPWAYATRLRDLLRERPGGMSQGAGCPKSRSFNSSLPACSMRACREGQCPDRSCKKGQTLMSVVAVPRGRRCCEAWRVN